MKKESAEPLLTVEIITNTYDAHPESYVINTSFDHEMTLEELTAWCNDHNMSGVVKVYYQGKRMKQYCYLFYYCED
jgi:hypothetical protein